MPRPKRSKAGSRTKVKHEWAVEKIVAKRYLGDGSAEYFVKWVGFPQTSNTWEPPENLQNCLNIIEDYEAKLHLLSLKNGNGDSKDSSPSLPVRDPYGSVTEFGNVQTLEETVDEEPPVECRKETIDDYRRPARAFHNFRYDDKAEDLFYMVEWADGDECEEIPGSVAREKYPFLLIQFLSQRYARLENRM